MKNFIIAFLLLSLSTKMTGQKTNKIEIKGMEVEWYYKKNNIHFVMTAPTKGWVTIGFNESNSTTKAYLLMGRIHQNKAEVLEHFTVSPGNYKPIKAINDKILIKEVSGFESNNTSTISFSVEVCSECKYQKDLSAGKSYWMILAYSRDDDFQHHSIMRTSVKIKL